MMKQSTESIFRFRLIIGLFSFLATAMPSCGAKHWRVITTDPTMHTLPVVSISFTSPRNGWVITPSEAFETTDGGLTWTKRMEEEGQSYQSMIFANATTGWIVGSQFKNGKTKAMVLHTLDGGKEWSQQPLEIDCQLHALSFCGTKVGWALGSDTIAYTENGGTSWQIQYISKMTDRLLSVACLDSERAWVVGENGTVLRTDDGGKNWSPTNLKTNKTLVRMRFFGNTGWIMGVEGTLIRTLNGGIDWKQQSVGTSEGISDIYFVGTDGWLVGMSGLLQHSSDAGATWTKEESPTTNDLFTLFFLDPNHGWIGGARRTVLGLPE